MQYLKKKVCLLCLALLTKAALLGREIVYFHLSTLTPALMKEFVHCTLKRAKLSIRCLVKNISQNALYILQKHFEMCKLWVHVSCQSYHSRNPHPQYYKSAQLRGTKTGDTIIYYPCLWCEIMPSPKHSLYSCCILSLVVHTMVTES